MAKVNIMIVEDDAITTMGIENQVKQLGYGVSAKVSYGKNAIKKAKENTPDLVLMDIVLKGKGFNKSPEEVLFKDYVSHWWEEMSPGMTEGQVRDYSGVLKNHLSPFFGDMAFSDINSVSIKKFLVHLKARKNRYGNPLAAKTIINYMTPFKVIYNDALVEYEWDDLKNPFQGVKLPKPVKRRIQPFDYMEWIIFLDNMFYWYKPYFKFAVQTGLRPSEQVALKWDAIDNDFIYIECSRVRNIEKDDLKTEGSTRRIGLRQNMLMTLDKQWGLTKKLGLPYVFITTKGLPIRQENLGKRWRKAFFECQIRYRCMYETRHTFASWALAAGESPECVARTLGHVNTAMVYRTYGRYIPNLTRHDGSEFERRYTDAINNEKKSLGTIRHNFRHNLQKSEEKEV